MLDRTGCQYPAAEYAKASAVVSSVGDSCLPPPSELVNQWAYRAGCSWTSLLLPCLSGVPLKIGSCQGSFLGRLDWSSASAVLLKVGCLCPAFALLRWNTPDTVLAWLGIRHQVPQYWVTQWFFTEANDYNSFTPLPHILKQTFMHQKIDHIQKLLLSNVKMKVKSVCFYKRKAFRTH